MKKLFLWSLIACFSSMCAQVGIGTASPSTATMLDISAGTPGNYRGFLPPRVPTILDQNAMTPTVQDVGLIVFVEETGCLDFWNGSAWENIYCTGGPSDVWINEFHYFDNGGDNSEFIEIAGVAGTDISGYYIARYNGNGGVSYDSLLPFTGTLPNEQNGYGTASISAVSLQNAVDGFALIDPDGRVVQFLSYEGTFPAVGGPANGLLSQDVMITEDGGTNVNQSIHLTGIGNTFTDFTWATSTMSTPGSRNNGQTFN